MGEMFNGTSLSEGKCAIHNSFSVNEAWSYDWSEFVICNETSFISTEILLHQITLIHLIQLH